MSEFRDLILKHKGKRICVLGGGGIGEVPKADLYISTNAHHVDKVTPDYVLAMDEVNSRVHAPMGEFIRARTDAPIISPHRYTDLLLANWPQCPRFVLSGMVATWAAYMMGAKVVILAGCDAYGGQDSGYMLEASKIARDVFCPVRVAGGGPLTKVWPEYDPGETFGRYRPHSSIEGWLGMDGEITVKVIKSCTLRNRDRIPGEEVRLMRHEAARELKHKMVAEV